MAYPEIGQRWVSRNGFSACIFINYIDANNYVFYVYGDMTEIDASSAHIKDIMAIFRLDKEYEWYRQVLML